MPAFDVTVAGERALLVRVDAPPSPALTRTLLALAEDCRVAFGGAISDTLPGYQTLAVFFDAGRLNRETLRAWLSAWQEHQMMSDEEAVTEIPVWYDPEAGADLEWLSRHANMSVEALIEVHTGTDYFAYANGFAPGFCYLGEIDPQIAAPRLASPRRAVPAGSVAIADRQTAVYPCVSPGGWRLIGRCPLPLFDAEQPPYTGGRGGNTARYIAADRQQFLDLGGQL